MVNFLEGGGEQYLLFSAGGGQICSKTPSIATIRNHQITRCLLHFPYVIFKFLGTRERNF